MIWQQRWRSISDQIAGVITATRLYAECIAVNSSDGGAAKRNILPATRRIFTSVEALKETSDASMPRMAHDVLLRFLTDENRSAFEADVGSEPLRHVVSRVSALACLQGEFESATRDFDALATRLAERAFAHLQRCIIADSVVQAAWKSAFKSGEVACERLGATHLLWHGIWAFKVSGAGERTDLVLGTPLPADREIASVADALVLTEWKKVTDASKVEAAFVKAIQQADLYSRGVLGGIELHSLRYVVIVTRERCDAIPADRTTPLGTYRCIGLAVEPAVPSKAGAVRKAPITTVKKNRRKGK
jgi:hypothetical protein